MAQLPQFPVRPNETNPDVLKALKFLEQANFIFDRYVLTEQQKTNICSKLDKMCQELNRMYTLEAKESADCEKLVNRLKKISEQSFSLLEDKRSIAELSLKIEEYKRKIGREYNDIRELTSSVQRMKIETRQAQERNEKRKSAAMKSITDIQEMSNSIKENLENSSEVGILRKLEEEKRESEEIVKNLQIQEKQLAELIFVKKATVKAETKQPFKKMVIDCAKYFHQYNTIVPKLEKTKNNIEKLKAEEAARKANGSLDETVLFDHSFVHASMEGSQPTKETENEPANTNATSKNIPADKNVVEESNSVNHSEQSSRDTSLSTNGSDIQNITLFEKPSEETDHNMEQDNVVEEEEEMNEESDDRENCDVTNRTIDEDAEMPEEEKDEDETILDSQEMDSSNCEETNKEVEPENEEEKDKSIDILVDENGDKDKEKEDGAEMQVDAEESLLNISNSSGGAQSQSFFDQLLSKKGKKEKKSAADAILDTSMNSNDGAGDLLKEIGTGIEDDAISEGSSNQNFSFSIFGAGPSGNDSQSNNLDFNFGASSGDNNGFDFLNSGGSGDGGAETDLFNFGKGDNNPFGFNFDSGSNDGPDAGGASFFNF